MINNPNYAIAINIINVTIMVVLGIMAIFHGRKQVRSGISQFYDPDYYFFTISLFLLSANGFALYRSMYVYFFIEKGIKFDELINLTTFCDRSSMLFAFTCLFFLGRNFKKLRS